MRKILVKIPEVNTVGNFYHANQSSPDALKTGSKRAIKKTAEATDDLIGNKIADKISKTSPQKNSETVTNEEEILKERYISPENIKANY